MITAAYWVPLAIMSASFGRRRRQRPQWPGAVGHLRWALLVVVAHGVPDRGASSKHPTKPNKTIM